MCLLSVFILLVAQGPAYFNDVAPLSHWDMAARLGARIYIGVIVSPSILFSDPVCGMCQPLETIHALTSDRLEDMMARC